MHWPFWRKRQDEDLKAEIESHLQLDAAERQRQGESADQAQLSARREFGNLLLVQEVTRDTWRWMFWEHLWQDVTYGARVLAKSPGYSIIAIITLALGIGLNTALFSIVNTVLLNPLPYPDSDQLVTLHESKPNFEAGSISYLNFRDWQKDNQTFSAMAISRRTGYSLTGMGDAEWVRGLFITSDYLPMLGVQPVRGRSFLPREDEIGGPAIVMIGEGFWKRKFGGATDVSGKSITLDGKPYAIVGIVPGNFDLGMTGNGARDVYVPIGQWANPLLQHRDAGLGIHGIGRLKPGITLAQARSDMERVSSNLSAAFPDTNKGIGASMFSLREEVVGHVQKMLIVLLAAVGCVLLIACVNVANLTLARSSARTKEFAVRVSLGAYRSRLIRQLLTESMLLAMAGGILGLGLAAVGTQAIVKLFPSALPRAQHIAIDGRVLAFTFTVCTIAGILFGLIPALKTSRPNINDTLKTAGRGMSGARHRAQGVLVVVEMALALVLLVGAGLLSRTLVRLWSQNPGFDSHHVLSLNIALPPSMSGRNPDELRATFRSVGDRLRATPGVEASTLSWASQPLEGDDEELFWLENEPKPSSAGDMKWALKYVVEPGYLSVLRTPLLRGRFLSESDNEHAPLVAVVDEVLANTYFPNQDPIGRILHLNNFDRPAQIVGIVKHVKQWGLDLDDQYELRAQLYLACMQLPDNAMRMGAYGTGLLVRSGSDMDPQLKSLRESIQQINRDFVVFGAQSMDSIVSDSLAERKFSMILFSAFAVLALLLAAVGIYGVVSYLVGQRTHEIGVRMALGARRSNVLALVLGQGARMSAIGIVIGLVAALGLSRFLIGMLYGVGAMDPLTYVGMLLLLGSIALLACYLPARRATRVDPLVALRYE